MLHKTLNNRLSTEVFLQMLRSCLEQLKLDIPILKEKIPMAVIPDLTAKKESVYY